MNKNEREAVQNVLEAFHHHDRRKTGPSMMQLRLAISNLEGIIHTKALETRTSPS